MIVITVEVFVKPGKDEQFRDATLKNRLGTRKEPGNLRFDLLQSREEPGKFFLFEVFKNGEAFESHKKTPHFLEWHDAVKPWMEKSKITHTFEPCFPLDEGDW